MSVIDDCKCCSNDQSLGHWHEKDCPNYRPLRSKGENVSRPINANNTPPRNAPKRGKKNRNRNANRSSSGSETPVMEAGNEGDNQPSGDRDDTSNQSGVVSDVSENVGGRSDSSANE